MRFARCITKVTDTLRIWNTYCFSTPTTVTRTRHNVMLNVICLVFNICTDVCHAFFFKDRAICGFLLLYSYICGYMSVSVAILKVPNIHRRNRWISDSRSYPPSTVSPSEKCSYRRLHASCWSLETSTSCL